MKQITIGWLYPRLMSTYGDRGNIISLSKRCEWREIDAKVIELNVGFDKKQLEECDLLFMGGAQDREQKVVSEDLLIKKEILLKKIERGVPGLFICGAYQFLGKYYKEADGTIINGLGIFDLYTESSNKKERLIGNIAVKTNEGTIIGFENHGGRTFLGKDAKPLGKVISGFGNNGKDGTEGLIYKNSIGTYLHGPILPKNPSIADFLIEKALEIKYKEKTVLKVLDDSLENKAKSVIAKRMSINL